MAGEFSLFQKPPDCLWGPPSLLCNVYRGYVPGVEWPGREVNDLFPCSAEVKKRWSLTSLPPICLLGVDMETLTFITLPYTDLPPYPPSFDKAVFRETCSGLGFVLCAGGLVL